MEITRQLSGPSYVISRLEAGPSLEGRKRKMERQMLKGALVMKSRLTAFSVQQKRHSLSMSSANLNFETDALVITKSHLNNMNE